MAPLNRVPRRVLALVAIATVFGAGVGLQLTGAGLAVTPGLGLWMTVVAGGALAVVLLGRTWEPSRDIRRGDETAWTEFRRELRRARRHRRALTLVRIPHRDSDAAASRDLRDLTDRIGAGLRLIDRAWVDNGNIYVMLPESSRAAASVAVERLMTLDSNLSADDVRVASFPDDGLTSGALIAAVHDMAIDRIPIPIRPVAEDGVAFAREDDLPMGEIAIQR